MNKSELEKIISKNDGKVFNSTKDFEINSLTTNLQFANDKTLVTYNIGDEDSERIFHERLSVSNPGFLLLNKKLKSEISIPYGVIDASKIKNTVEELLNIVYPVEESSLKIFGITGTNGKSTCVNLCEQIVVQCGEKAASLGTVGVSVNGKEVDLNITGTTPSFIDLRRILFELKDSINYLFMEVSSHAIAQGRLGEVKLSGAGWTSFSQDHLDFHSSMEEYFEAKAKIVEYLKDGQILIPSSQKKLLNDLEGKIGKEKVREAHSLSNYDFGELPDFFKVHYNKDNLELSLGLLSDHLDLSNLDLSKIKTPKGRFSIEKVGEKIVVIDYAHTPDAIENLTSATRSAFPDARIITLFGCGGDRDKSKRPLMASAAEKFSDDVIVTSDNPRSEEPDEIIKDILPGLKSEPLLVDSDREKAITQGVEHLNDGDVLIVAGKGHEEYQEIKGEKLFFSDFSVIKGLRN